MNVNEITPILLNEHKKKNELTINEIKPEIINKHIRTAHTFLHFYLE